MIRNAKRYIFAQLYQKQWHRKSFMVKIDVESENEARAEIRIAIARGDKINENLTKKADYDAFQLRLTY